MLRPAKEFRNFTLRARDGDIGKAKEFYFDDHHWTVRYLVADTGSWLNGRRVLISPYALDPVDEAEQVLPVDLLQSPTQFRASHWPAPTRACGANIIGKNA